MKKFSKTLLLLMMSSFLFAGCTDNISDDDETILQTYAIDKEDSVNPNNNGEDPDCEGGPEDPDCD